MKSIALLLISLVPAPSLRAADWLWQPAFEWRMDNQSNRLLSNTDATASQAVWLSFDASLKRDTEDSELSLRPHFGIQRFVNESRLNSEDGSLQAAGRWLFEYSQFALSADAARVSTLITELSETGIVDANGRRNVLDANASWSQNIAPQSELDTQLGVSDIKYPDGLRQGLVSYRYTSASLSLARRQSDYLTWNLTAFGGDLDAPLALTKSRDLGLRAGLTRALSLVMRLDLSAGITNTRLEDFFGSRNDRSQVWLAKLTRATEMGQWSLSAERNIVPNGRGVLARRDELALGFSRPLSAMLTASLGLHAIRNADRGTSGLNSDDYRYYTGEAALARTLTQAWTLALRVGANNAQRLASDTDAHGWYAAVTLDWAPGARAIRDWDLL